MTTQELIFLVGNRAVQLENEKWKWNVFVRLQQCEANNMVAVKNVVMHLHPTFRRTQVALNQSNKDALLFDSKTFVGWGTFVIKVDVFVVDRDKNEGKVCLQHELKFTGGGHTTSHRITLLLGHEPSREEMLKLLAKQQELEPSSPLFWHGRGYNGGGGSPVTLPIKVWHSDQKPRDDHDETPDWLTASEYCDVPPVMQVKIKQLKALLELSMNTVIYSGAGISSAAGIGQAARGAHKGKNLSTTAQPTFTHRALATLANLGYIQGGWAQQNHDGLPQKAGFPQENINKIHGSWYDPSNPVVKYSGCLKTEEFKWMQQQSRRADLVLVLGTTLGGLTADQIAHAAADRSLSGQSLGMVVINLQQTEHDGMAALRIFGETDKVFEALLNEMGIDISSTVPLLVRTPD